MEKYQVIKKIGDGTFGTVFKAWNNASTEHKEVAIKKLKRKYVSWEKAYSLPEIQTLIELHHPNIVKLLEVIKSKNEVYLIFECLDRNVYEMMKDSHLDLTQIRNIIFQTLQGLEFIHSKDMFHRDLKPENLLESQGTVKIADFGLIKHVKDTYPFTDYVSTRWYRAPEIIIGAPDYGPSVDIFALGCIFAELYTKIPLFPGRNESDQLNKELQILGSPSKSDFPSFYELAVKNNFKINKYNAQSLKHVLKCSNNDVVDLIDRMIRLDPKERITAQDALQHEFFQVRLVSQVISQQNVDSFRQIQNSFTASNNKSSFYENQSNSETTSRGRTSKLKSDYSKSDVDDEEDVLEFYLKDARYKPGVNFMKYIIDRNL